MKCEHLQKIGAFKIRGATNLIQQLSDEERARGVVAHSSGNHGQAVALAARTAGAQATIVMPRGANKLKRLRSWNTAPPSSSAIPTTSRAKPRRPAS